MIFPQTYPHQLVQRKQKSLFRFNYDKKIINLLHILAFLQKMHGFLMHQYIYP